MRARGSGPRPDRRDWPERLFGAAVVANLAPVLWFTFLPTRDGPAHAFNAALIGWLVTGRAGPAAALVRWNPSPVPNWLGHAVMAVSGAVVGPWLAERVLIALIALSLPFALRYAIRAVTSVPTGLEYLALPLVWGTHLHWGFYNFCLSLSLYLVSLGYWLRHREAFGGRHLLVFATLAVLTYFASALALLHLMVAVVVLIGLPSRWAERRWNTLVTATAAAPALVLLVVFVMFRPAGPEPTTVFPSARWASASLFRLDILRGADVADHAVTTAMAVAFWGLAAWALLRPSREQWTRLGLLLGTLVVFDVAVLYLAPTSTGGGTLLTPRQACFAMLAIVLCLAANARRLPQAKVIATVTLALVVGLHLSRWRFYTDYDRAMHAFVGSPAAAVDGPFYAAPLDCEHPGRDPRSGAVCLSEHAGAYVAMARHALLVNDYELLTAHFPLVAARTVSNGEQAWVGGDEPLESILLWRGSMNERRRLARRLVQGRPIDCEVQGAGEVPATLFLATCPARP